MQTNGETAVFNRISRIDLMAKGSSRRDIDLVPQSVKNQKAVSFHSLPKGRASHSTLLIAKANNLII